MFNPKSISIMTNKKPQGAFYERAPDILMGRIAELNSVLTNYRNNGHSAEVLKFYNEVLDVMKLAHLYMQQTKFIHHRNALLESSYRFLSHLNQGLLHNVIWRALNNNHKKLFVITKICLFGGHTYRKHI